MLSDTTIRTDTYKTKSQARIYNLSFENLMEEMWSKVMEKNKFKDWENSEVAAFGLIGRSGFRCEDKPSRVFQFCYNWPNIFSMKKAQPMN